MTLSGLSSRTGAMGIEPRTQRGTALERLSGLHYRERRDEGWENCLIANVIQWNVLGGLGVLAD